MVKALGSMPGDERRLRRVDGKPTADASRPTSTSAWPSTWPSRTARAQLLVPSIKAAETMDFAQFWTAYEDIVRKARDNKLTVEDFAGTTITPDQPRHHRHGPLGAPPDAGPGRDHRRRRAGVPRRVAGRQPETLNRNAVSKIMTLTSTYDHRVIQGAQSGEFLRVVHQLLLGEDGFYDEIFESCASPTSRSAGSRTSRRPHDDDINKIARVQELIHAYRVRGHLMADTDPLEYRQRRHPDLDITTHGLTLWDLDRDFATGGFGGEPFLKLREILGILRDSYCRTIGIEYMHIQDPEQRDVDPGQIEAATTSRPARSSCASCAGSTRPRRSRRSCRPSSSARSGSPSRAASRLIPLLDAILSARRQDHWTRSCIGMAHRGRLNVLANIAGKSYGQIFREFEGKQDPELGPGLRRREVPPRHRGHVHRRGRRGDQGLPRRQPLATWRRSTRCSRASCAPSRTASTSPARRSPCCRC